MESIAEEGSAFQKTTKFGGGEQNMGFACEPKPKKCTMLCCVNGSRVSTTEYLLRMYATMSTHVKVYPIGEDQHCMESHQKHNACRANKVAHPAPFTAPDFNWSAVPQPQHKCLLSSSSTTFKSIAFACTPRTHRGCPPLLPIQEKNYPVHTSLGQNPLASSFVSIANP